MRPWCSVWNLLYPALFVAQGCADERGKTSLIFAWVKRFGDQVLHHVAVRVEDIEVTIRRFSSKACPFPETSSAKRAGCCGRCSPRPNWWGANPSPFWNSPIGTAASWAFRRLRPTAS